MFGIKDKKKGGESSSEPIPLALTSTANQASASMSLASPHPTEVKKEPVPHAAFFTGLKTPLEKPGRRFLGYGVLKYQKERNRALSKAVTAFLYNDLLLLCKNKRLRAKWGVQASFVLDESVTIAIIPPLGFSLFDANFKPPRQSFFTAPTIRVFDDWLALFGQTGLHIPGKSSSDGASGPVSPRMRIKSFHLSGSLSSHPSLPVDAQPRHLREELKGSIEAGLRVIDRAETALQTSLVERGGLSASAGVPVDPLTAQRRSQLLKMKGTAIPPSQASHPDEAHDQTELLKVAYSAAINLWQSNRQVNLLAERSKAAPTNVPPPPKHKHASTVNPNPPAALSSSSSSSSPPISKQAHELSSPKQARDLMRQDTMAACAMIKHTKEALLLTNVAPDPGPETAHPDLGGLYDVLYDYLPRKKAAKRVLALQVGDVVTMIKPLNEDWALGRFEGKRGLFPLRFCRRRAESQRLVVSTSPPSVAPANNASPVNSTSLDSSDFTGDQLVASSQDQHQEQLAAASPDEAALSQSTPCSVGGTTSVPPKLRSGIRLGAPPLSQNRPLLSFGLSSIDLTKIDSPLCYSSQTVNLLRTLDELADTSGLIQDLSDASGEQSILALDLTDICAEPIASEEPTTQQPEGEPTSSDTEEGEDLLEGETEEEEEEAEEAEDEEEITDPLLKEIKQFEKDAGEIASWLELEIRRRNQNPKALKNAQVFADNLRIKAIPFLEKFISHPDAVSIIVRIHEALSLYDREIEGAEEKVGLVNKYDLRRLGQSDVGSQSNKQDSDSEDSESSSYSSYSDDAEGFDVYQPQFDTSLYGDL